MAFRAAWLLVLYLCALAAHAIPPPLEARGRPVLPEKDPFYIPPEGYEKAAPGEILRSREVPYPIAAFTTFRINLAGAYQLLYRSSDNFGKPTATVTTVLVPHKADYNKVVSYQVAEDAASINCAPSMGCHCSRFRRPQGCLLGERSRGICGARRHPCDFGLDQDHWGQL
ncbi:lipase 8 [Coccidioides immitis H538.4]|uniref:Lipase 8 n=1 Tax=Coccidioides immitis H538.4 TaxID=396776 RepID=A0A0J8RFC4_COCIT|nr:lipase 8 [Coccidioides immitis H538.4]